MKAVSGIPNPLLEASIAVHGPRLVFRHSGATMDPIAGQFEFDFEGGGARLEIVDDGAVSETQRQSKINTLFFEGVRCEEQGKVAEAAALYEETLSLGEHAPAAINLGTILYNQRQFERAEKFYRRATIANPDYALAFFDLGNALDELQRLPEAVEAYKAAIRLSPGYADAHYNLALAFERSNERRRALRHWLAYVKLDPVGPWSNHARLQVRKILDREELAVVWRRPRIGLTPQIAASTGLPLLATRCRLYLKALHRDCVRVLSCGQYREQRSRLRLAVRRIADGSQNRNIAGKLIHRQQQESIVGERQRSWPIAHADSRVDERAVVDRVGRHRVRAEVAHPQRGIVGAHHCRPWDSRPLHRRRRLRSRR